MSATENFVNNKMFMLCGYSAQGKTRSLKNIKNQEDWIYYNCEAGKAMPFKSKFNQVVISDPLDLLEDVYAQIVNDKEMANDKDYLPYKGMIIDSLDFLMDQYESLYCYKVADSRQGWQDYNQFFKELFQTALVQWGKPVICICHLVADSKNATEVTMEHTPIKGSLKNSGMEAYFNQVIYARKMDLRDLKKYEGEGNKLLNITNDEREDGFKYCFQTRSTKMDIKNTIRGPDDMFTRKESYTDNDCQLILDRLNEYYSDETETAISTNED